MYREDVWYPMRCYGWFFFSSKRPYVFHLISLTHFQRLRCSPAPARSPISIKLTTIYFTENPAAFVERVRLGYFECWTPSLLRIPPCFPRSERLSGGGNASHDSGASVTARTKSLRIGQFLLSPPVWRRLKIWKFQAPLSTLPYGSDPLSNWLDISTGESACQLCWPCCSGYH